ncbi:hypothetical protein E4U59_002894 [Claviceps monticola]|nr:hypothetical protein E4U59_002894 [Claviceps monticola]
MGKLSPSLKALIHASFARPDPVPASAAIREVYQSIARDATARKLGVRPWLVMSTAATITLNSPDSLPILHDIASMGQTQLYQTQNAELMREVGLKCISFNGIPRTINCLNAFHDALPRSVQSSLETQPSRMLMRENVDDVSARGRRLWDSVYAPLEERLLEKLARAHPDLPVHILSCHYGPLLSDPVSGAGGKKGRASLGRTGRVLTSLLAIACLRAQMGVGPQVYSHVLGLRKAFEDGTWTAEGDHNDADGPASAGKEDAEAWLAGDQGLEWILRSVDAIAEALGEGRSDHWSRNSKL